MADPFAYSDRTGSAITGTASQSLLGAALSIPTVSLEVDTEFVALGEATYLNDTGSAHNVDLDLYANGNLIHRSRLYTLAANADTRSIRAEYDITITESNTAIVGVHASVGAAGNTGNDIRNVSPVFTGQTFDISAPVTLDWKATLSSVSDLATHSLTPIRFRMNTLGSFTVVSGGGGGSLDEVPDEFPEAWVWTGSAYEMPTGGFFPRVRFFIGPVEPNGVNSPSLIGYYVWEDTSGA